MSVNMVEAILRIILDYENTRLRPKLALADRLDDLPKSQVIIGHTGSWRRIAGLRTRRMVAGERQVNQIRQLPCPFIGLQFVDKDLGPVDVRHNQGKPRIAS